MFETCRVSCQNKFVKLVHLVGFIIKKKRIKSIGHTTQFHTNIMNPRQLSQYRDFGYALDDPGFVPGWRNRFPSSPGYQTSSGTLVASHSMSTRCSLPMSKVAGV
jgi:hypothetical protein